MTSPEAVQTAASLPPKDTEAVLALVGQAAEVDGFSALNEAASLRLRHPHPDTTHLLAYRGEQLAGYGQLALVPGRAPSTTSGHRLRQAQSTGAGALVVHPRFRRQGIGASVLQAMIIGGYRLEIWAVRHTPAARALAARVGLVPVRQLLIMTRSLTEPVPVVEVPAEVEIRSFRPGHDENGWLAVNARAFADHPEQGSITRADLEERMSESWFDPAGFLVAVRPLRQADLLGFHWTKQHPDRLGEVYVLGVDPDAGVRGLGRALLAAGLDHLQRVGNTEVELYVDADNPRAVALYDRAGFGVARSDVMYASPNAEVEPLATMQVSSDP